MQTVTFVDTSICTDNLGDESSWTRPPSTGPTGPTARETPDYGFLDQGGVVVPRKSSERSERTLRLDQGPLVGRSGIGRRRPAEPTRGRPEEEETGTKLVSAYGKRGLLPFVDTISSRSSSSLPVARGPLDSVLLDADFLQGFA
jgi:hypothetical protein